MHARNILTVVAVAAALLFSGQPIRAQEQSTGDPLADAARKAREQKKNAPKAKRVLTDDDIAPRLTPVPTTAPAPGTPASTQTSEKPELAASKKGAEKEDPNSEQAWRRRFAEQHRRIADAEQELEVLQREAQKADVQYYADPQKAMQEQFSRDEINAKNAKIEAKKKQLADLKQQLIDMEDQLRASGGDSGWAR